MLSENDFVQSNATYSTGACIPDGCYTFTIFDSFGDGLLSGYYEGFLNCNPEADIKGDEFEYCSEQTHTFCCENKTCTISGSGSCYDDYEDEITIWVILFYLTVQPCCLVCFPLVYFLFILLN